MSTGSNKTIQLVLIIERPRASMVGFLEVLCIDFDRIYETVFFNGCRNTPVEVKNRLLKPPNPGSVFSNVTRSAVSLLIGACVGMGMGVFVGVTDGTGVMVGGVVAFAGTGVCV